MMNQYEAIVGLSGSLGSPSEQAFMRSTYGVRTMMTPPFLSTCQDMKKSVPVLHGNIVYVAATEAEQFAEIRRLALRFRMDVPVVVLANDVVSAKAIYADCFTAQDKAVHTVQLFLEIDPVSGKPADYSTVVKEATRPKQSSLSRSGSIWPITVSDPFGGRGQDYTVLKEEVDNAGGIMVICAAIPESQREWVQWLGRTARSDRRGQFAVVLLKDSSPLKTIDPAVLAAHAAGAGAYKPSLIDVLLDKRDENIKTKLDTLAPELAHGMRMHEVCYAFWQKQEGGCDVAKWPADDDQKSLREFITRNGFMSTPEAVAQFGADTGLAPTPAAYVAQAKYCK